MFLGVFQTVGLDVWKGIEKTKIIHGTDIVLSHSA